MRRQRNASSSGGSSSRRRQRRSAAPKAAPPSPPPPPPEACMRTPAVSAAGSAPSILKRMQRAEDKGPGRAGGGGATPNRPRRPACAAAAAAPSSLSLHARLCNPRAKDHSKDSPLLHADVHIVGPGVLLAVGSSVEGVWCCVVCSKSCQNVQSASAARQPPCVTPADAQQRKLSIHAGCGQRPVQRALFQRRREPSSRVLLHAHQAQARSVRCPRGRS